MDGKQYNLFKNLLEYENDIKCATGNRDGTLEEIEAAGLKDALKDFRAGKWLPEEDQKLVDDAIDLYFKIMMYCGKPERKQFVKQHDELIKAIEQKDLLDDYLLGVARRHYNH